MCVHLAIWMWVEKDMEQLRNGVVVETTDNGCKFYPFLHSSFLPPSPLPAACLVLDGWRRQELQVGSDRNDKEFSDELKEDCTVRGMGRGRVRGGGEG